MGTKPIDRQDTRMLPADVAAGLEELKARDQRVSTLEEAIREAMIHHAAAWEILRQALIGVGAPKRGGE